MWELLQKLENLWWKPYWKSIAELTETEKNVRLLTSLSSWLWQFVCENGMIDREHKRPAYRLIESALCDEDELEEFLLNSIKLD